MTVSDTSDLEQRLARQAEKANQAEDVSVGDIIDYVKDYAKQETLGPLKGAGNWLGYGFAAAAALGLGLVLCWSACSVCCRPNGSVRPPATCRGSRT